MESLFFSVLCPRNKPDPQQFTNLSFESIPVHLTLSSIYISIYTIHTYYTYILYIHTIHIYYTYILHVILEALVPHTVNIQRRRKKRRKNKT